VALRLELDKYADVQTSPVETLLVGGDLDFSTPPQIATKELLPYLPNGHQVVLKGFGHSATFWANQPEANTRMVNTFFDSGQVDNSLYTPQNVDFTPAYTYAGLAKAIAGLMVGLALLTALLMMLMALWVYKRGRFGPRVSAAMRLLSPVVLGLGGWMLGALIVLTTMSGVSLDNTLVATLSTGLPIGLGIYFAWVNRDWSAETKTTGFAAAMSGALIGAWLGFNAVEGPPAIATAIVGAGVGANLMLLGLDIIWDPSNRSRMEGSSAPSAPQPTVEGAHAGAATGERPRR
jgi:TAP-like protein